jgi:cytochrome c oxidase subunit 1
MTLTATRPPDAPAADTEVPVLVPETWLTTSDHKRVGRMYVVASLAFLLVGAGVGLAMELQRAGRHAGVVGDNYARLFSLHSTVTVLLFLGPLWVGLATYLVPLQIGARRLAFPRLAAMAFWTYVTGGVLLLASYAFGTPTGGGIALSQPLVAPHGGASRATDLWAASLIVITVASIAAAATLLTTIVKLRPEGMTLGRIPPYSWSVLATSAAGLLAGPIFVVGMLLVYLDEHFGGQLFAPTQGNAAVVWQHLVWLYGRPDVYLLFLPALGVVSEIVATHARRPLFMAPVVKAAIFGFAVLTFGVLAANATAEHAVVLPTPTLLSAFVLIPAGLCALLWLGTIRPAELRLHVSLLYVAGFLLLCVLGGGNAIAAAVKGLHGDSAWSTGEVHAVLFGAPALAAFGAVYHWAPKIWGRALHAGLGALQFLLMFGGFVVSAAGSWALGYEGAPWRIDDLTGAGSKSSWLAFSRLEGVGGVLITLGVLVFVVNMAVSLRADPGDDLDDPYEGSTLEWATTSPPPQENFAYLPDIRSDAPLADLRAARSSVTEGGAA